MNKGDKIESRDYIPPEWGEVGTDHERDVREAGPSDYVRRAWVFGKQRNRGEQEVMEVIENDQEDVDGNRIAKTKSSSQRRRIHRPLSTIPLVSALLAPFIPTASAAPPHFTRPTPTRYTSQTTTDPTIYASRNHPPRRLAKEERREVQYVTSAAPPSALPTQLQIVDETVLPYVMSQGPDGYWSKVDEGWRLYGRQSGVCFSI